MVSTRTSLVSVLLAAAAPAIARDVPANIRQFYDNVTSKSSCQNTLAGGFYSKDGDSGKAVYCGDKLDSGVIFLKGNGKTLVNMDIDCDGAQNGPADDGRCGNSGDTQSITSFQSTIKSYGAGINDVDAYIHPYVVFGNEGSKPGWATFNPEQYGIEPLSLMAVVCGNRLIYGVWADENGDDGEYPVVGEASISLATACYGKDAVDGNTAHDEDDVLYIAFTGSEAVPGASGAKWNAQSFSEFESSVQSLGDKLIQRISS
ncbi:unnamed protein product [Clonostachys chloroleuca]|uniref:Endo-chitosanase n=1 Tax=Clonostachys chloroleuca TaxID=1926264 RepID=A0AA35QCI0_9HYPO|nr:unnamed protein product [Clonostachys chloroleuca]